MILFNMMINILVHIYIKIQQEKVINKKIIIPI